MVVAAARAAKRRGWYLSPGEMEVGTRRDCDGYVWARAILDMVGVIQNFKPTDTADSEEHDDSGAGHEWQPDL